MGQVEGGPERNLEHKSPRSKGNKYLTQSVPGSPPSTMASRSTVGYDDAPTKNGNYQKYSDKTLNLEKAFSGANLDSTLSYEERRKIDQHLDDIVFEMRKSKVIEIKDRRRYLHLHSRCVKATSNIDWFCSAHKTTREEAVEFGKQLVESNRLYLLGTEKEFRDDTDLLLRFQQDFPNNGIMNVKKFGGYQIGLRQ